ncbi:ATP-binding cassette domain-containing protein [Clostridioides sp. ZZV14-6048]|uniref:ATP-binding cassette domain-containing protein n=1 Tax=Clostridioides sp. ZZV14-6048 TaxID=2811490 RepID=UPI0039BC48F6
MSKHTKEKSERLITDEECPQCHGKRLNKDALNCTILGYSIADMGNMEFTELYNLLSQINDKKVETVVNALTDGLKRMIDIGLPYLHLNRESTSLSGGEAQRLKLVRYMGSSLTGLTYIFDEPSTGMHPRDVYCMNQLLKKLRDRGNTVLVVEHDKDVISIADEIIDIGPNAGKHGGNIIFQGTYNELLLANTLTSKAMNLSLSLKSNTRKAKSFLPIRGACLHNLKNVDINIPVGIMTVVTGVAGSGKSTLISRIFAKKYEKDVIKIDQNPITTTNRSMPATFLGFFDEIRKLFAKENTVGESLFSFNSKGACPICNGKGVLVTELVFMDPVVNTCEACKGTRYNEEVLSKLYKGKNIVEVLSMTVDESLEFFTEKKLCKILQTMKDVGLSYMTLGQPLSTLSGGECQRIKLAKNLNKKGNTITSDFLRKSIKK